MKLVTDLWVPETMAGMNLSELESGEWNLKKELSKTEIKKLRKVFIDQGKEYVVSSCLKSGFSRSLVFVSENQEVVGSIYFCSDGYAIEARPTLRPGKGKNFFWNKEGVEEFKEFLEGLD